MNTKKISNFYYIALLSSFVIYALPPQLKWAVYTPNFLGYVLIALTVLALLLLLLLLVLKIKKSGFVNGIKDTSLHIFSLILVVVVSFFITKYYIKKDNKITVEVFNESELGISNIKIIGRNNTSQIDTLAPSEKKTVLFYGRNIHRKRNNDYENEVSLRFYLDQKWREKKILREFSR